MEVKRLRLEWVLLPPWLGLTLTLRPRHDLRRDRSLRLRSFPTYVPALN